MKLQILNDQDEVKREVRIAGSSFLVAYNTEWGVEYDTTSFQDMVWDEKHILKQHYQKNARELIKKYEDHLLNVYPHQIAFIVDGAWQPSEKGNKNSAWKIDIKKSPLWFRLLTGFEYMMLMRQCWIERWSPAQINAAIMSQLLRIDAESENILKYSECDDNNKMVATFGANYLEPEVIIRDLLEEQIPIIGLRKASAQITMEEALAEQKERGGHGAA